MVRAKGGTGHDSGRTKRELDRQIVLGCVLVFGVQCGTAWGRYLVLSHLEPGAGWADASCPWDRSCTGGGAGSGAAQAAGEAYPLWAGCGTVCRSIWGGTSGQRGAVPAFHDRDAGTNPAAVFLFPSAVGVGVYAARCGVILAADGAQI